MKIIGASIISVVLLIAGCNRIEKQSREDTSFVDPLPSWHEGTSKKSIIEFVKKTTTEGSEEFIPVADRVACFDNDGTLWSEQPMYFQLAFALDRIKALAPQHPEWKTKQPFKSLLEGDVTNALAGEHAVMEIVMTTHAGMTTEEFDTIVKEWMSTAIHPRTGKQYAEMIFQPMVELLNYLQTNGYKVFIVSGGGMDFMRAWVEDVYGIPPDQVVGSSAKVKYEVDEDGNPTLIKLPSLNFIDDKEAKPVGIHQYIGKRPVFSVGNSDGDYAMLQWTTTATGYPRFGMIIHHTDSMREWNYDRSSPIGMLNKGLDDASKYNWIIVDMESDWKKIYPFDK